MQKHILSIIFFVALFSSSFAQVRQVARYEMEKKNTDDFFSVASASSLGVVIFRDINREFSFSNKVDGDEWEITMLDTALQQTWQKEFTVGYDHIFKAYDLSNGHLYLLFRDGELVSSDYMLIDIDLPTGGIKRHEINNEIELDLSHITVVDDYIIIAGYVRYSPTVVSYKIGDKNLEVIPGFFKDRSDILDLKDNENGTFNVVTLESAYENMFLRLRTYSKDGAILFEREIDMAEGFSILSGKSTDFVDGNIGLTGTYGHRNSYYVQGVYFVIARPEGQKNTIEYVDFTDLERFFDYMGERRAHRIKNKIKRKNKAGKEYKYHTRLLLSAVKKVPDGFIVTAEVYDPRYERTNSVPGPGYYGSYLQPSRYGNYSDANHQYVKQPSRLLHVDDANHFEYLESVVLKLDKNGKLDWDQSFKIDKVESASLDPVVDFTVKNEEVMMLYKNEEEISYKWVIDQDSAVQEKQPIKLGYDNDEVKHNYDLVGGTQFWYDTNFLVWGYHKIGNKVNDDIDKNRSVLFINKVRFE